MGNLWYDLRYGARVLRKSPGFTVIAVIALALGIGANTAIFSVVNAVLLQPLPFEQPDQLMLVTGIQEGGQNATPTMPFSHPNFADLREQNQAFEQVAAYNSTRSFLMGGDEPEPMRGALVSADLFPLLRAQPIAGRVFTREEDQANGPGVMVISYELWQRRFGGDPGIIGQQLMLGSASRTVLGVMPPGFRFPVAQEATDFWIPHTANIPAGALTGRGSIFINVIARLRPDATLEQAQAELQVFARRLEEQYQDSNAGLSFRLTPLHEKLVGEVRPALLVFLGAVGFVLLIACANVANLMLARAAVRQKELAIRTALGAGRWRIMRQLLTESVLLACLGGALGLLIAVWGLDLLVAASPANIPRLQEIRLDVWVLSFTAGISLLTGIFFGLVPAWQASRPDLNETLKEGGRGSTEGLRRNRMRSALVVVEVALSLVLLVGAALLIQSFWRLREVNPGFNPDHLLTARLSLLNARYQGDEQVMTYYREAMQRLAALPGVEAVGAVNPLPLSGSATVFTFEIEGRPPAQPGQEPASDWRLATADYFRAMAIPVKQGRAFTERDTAGAPPVVIVNESFVRRYFPGEEALGRRLVISSEDNVTREIVGIVGDVRHLALEDETGPEVYVPFFQDPNRSMTFVIRTTTAPAGIAATVRGALRELDREQPITSIRPMEELLSEVVARRRFNMTLLAVFAGVALLLAAVGLFGVMSYSVTQRTHEIGIRIALGAQPGDVLKLVVGQGMMLALVGVGIGLAAAFLATRALTSLLYGVSATDPLTFAFTSLLLAGVALLACYLPARRATKVDPMEALRYE